MSETTRKTALADPAAELDQTPMPEPEADLVPAGDAAAQTEVERRMAEVDLNDTQSILRFGASAQETLTALSDRMLEGVRNKEMGPAGDALREMVATLKGFDPKELDPARERSWWERLTGSGRAVEVFRQRYEEVRGQIDGVTDRLLEHEHTLIKDVKFLDKLYAEALAFYRELGLFIAAGDARIARADAEEIPAAEQAVEAAAAEEQTLAAQRLRDLRTARDELERRVHDMRLTRQVTMQSLPAIRLVQENDKALINKINSTLLNTVPLWRTQLAQAVTIQRSREAAGAVKAAGDLTDELLRRNAETLAEANREVRAETERGAFSIEAVAEANQKLVATIEESLALADAGKARRAEAERTLDGLEADLRAALASAKARKTGAGQA